MVKKIDFRPIIAGLVLVGAFATAIILNLDHNKTGNTQVVNSLDIDNGDLDINWERYQSLDIKLTESLKISESGTYHLTGTLENGSITIEAGVGNVRLILDNVTITNQNGPAISCYDADDLVIETIGKNTLSDGEEYDSVYDVDVTGVIYSKADLTFQGEGSLDITSNYQDAIVGKDDVKFNSGAYHITAKDDAIRGKDSVYIVNGNFVIESGADVMKSTNEQDQGKGFILIENGSFSLTSTTAKGLKATKNLLIYGGNFAINTYDDAIHSDNYVGIVGGTININAGDDGIHANSELVIDGGSITIAKAYEGIEAQVITINNGEVSLTTNDDGINAGGGADESSKNRPGANQFNADESCILTINGGNIYVNSSGDGVDSNGWLYINGGTTIVDGPTNNGNGALDAGMEIVMNGGDAFAIGSSGMAESLGANSSVPNLSAYFNYIYPAGTTIEIKDSSDEIIFSHTSAKSFSHLAAGTNNFGFGKTYTIYINGEEFQQFTISNITTTIGKTQNSFKR